MEWLAALAAKGIFKIFGDLIVQPILQAFLKAKDVDLEKFKSANLSTEHVAVAVLDANVKFAQIKSTYALAILQWWPFRAILFCILLFCSVRFVIIVIDSTWWWLFGCTINGQHVVGDACSWSVPAIKGDYGKAEFEYILFFVIAKPVDTAIAGTVNLLSRYLAK